MISFTVQEIEIYKEFLNKLIEEVDSSYSYYYNSALSLSRDIVDKQNTAEKYREACEEEYDDCIKGIETNKNTIYHIEENIRKIKNTIPDLIKLKDEYRNLEKEYRKSADSYKATPQAEGEEYRFYQQRVNEASRAAQADLNKSNDYQRKADECLRKIDDLNREIRNEEDKISKIHGYNCDLESYATSLFRDRSDLSNSIRNLIEADYNLNSAIYRLKDAYNTFSHEIVKIIELVVDILSCSNQTLKVLAITCDDRSASVYTPVIMSSSDVILGLMKRMGNDFKRIIDKKEDLLVTRNKFLNDYESNVSKATANIIDQTNRVTDEKIDCFSEIMDNLKESYRLLQMYETFSTK